MVILWSPKRGVDLYFFRSDGRFVNKISRMLLALVGNVTNRSWQQSLITSRNLSFISLEY